MSVSLGVGTVLTVIFLITILLFMAGMSYFYFQEYNTFADVMRTIFVAYAVVLIILLVKERKA